MSHDNDLILRGQVLEYLGVEADSFDDATKCGGAPRYDANCRAAAYALRNAKSDIEKMPAAIAALPAVKPKVRALVWVGRDGLYRADGIMLVRYEALEMTDHVFLFCVLGGTSHRIAITDTLEAAQAAAQADYEGRILAALEWDAAPTSEMVRDVHLYAKAPNTARREAFRAGADAMRTTCAQVAGLWGSEEYDEASKSAEWLDGYTQARSDAVGAIRALPIPEVPE